MSHSLHSHFTVQLVETGRPGDLNSVCPAPEIAWNLPQKVEKPGQKRNLAENMDKVWNVKIYNISLY